MNIQKRPPRIAQSANRAAKLPSQEINGRIERKDEAASDTTEAKSELNAARLALQERSQTPEGREALANALDGRMASERTTVELLVMEELFLQEIGNLQGIQVRIAPQAQAGNIAAGQGPETALPEGVQAAYVPSKNVILVREGLKPTELKSAMAEELGERVAKLAETRGVKLAPGDVGARILKVMNGQPLTKGDFETKASDTVKVKVSGQIAEANASAREPTASSIVEAAMLKPIPVKNGKKTLTSMHIDVEFLKRNSGVLHRDRLVLEQYDRKAGRWRTVADGNNSSGHVNGRRIIVTDGKPPLLRFVNYSMPRTTQSSMKRDRYNIYGKLGVEHVHLGSKENAERRTGWKSTALSIVRGDVVQYGGAPSDYKTANKITGTAQFPTVFTLMRPKQAKDGSWSYDFHNSSTMTPGGVRGQTSSTLIKRFSDNPNKFGWEDGGNNAQHNGHRLDAHFELKMEYRAASRPRTFSKAASDTVAPFGNLDAESTLLVVDALSGTRNKGLFTKAQF